MATRFLKCDRCQQEYYQSDSKAFKIVCVRCNTIIGSNTGQDIWYDHTNYSNYWRPAPAPFNPFPESPKKISSSLLVILSIVALFAIALCTGLYYAPEKSFINQIDNAQTFAQPLTSETLSTTENPTEQATVLKAMSIYSGNCTYYRKELKDSTMTLVPVNSGYAKVVINRKLKKLYFYFNGKLVFHYFGYNDYTDDQQGGEGFTFDSDADAHRYTAERVFILNTEMVMSGQLGYQYQITNYKED